MADGRHPLSLIAPLAALVEKLEALRDEAPHDRMIAGNYKDCYSTCLRCRLDALLGTKPVEREAGVPDGR